MKSSSGAHYLALDHVRAVAVFMVVAWHFTHALTGYPVPFEGAPDVFPLALLDEGHTGVSLFMTLSGYLFAKLLEGKQIDFKAFLWNRALRLLPLLFLVVIAAGVLRLRDGYELSTYALAIAKGVVYPTLPNGGWSITVECHFYLLLPLLLWTQRKSLWGLPAILLGAIAIRALLFAWNGEVQELAYWTIVGRIDQFLLGMIACRHRKLLARRNVWVAIVSLAFMAVYWDFDRRGGFYLSPKYPSTRPLWIVLPTIEGLAYAVAIAWYDGSYKPRERGWSRFLGRVGEYSYAIYLLHFFFVFHAARFVDVRIMSLSNFYVACAWSVVFLALMMIPAHLSYRLVESPFLRKRRPYARVATPPPPGPATPSR